MTGKDRIIYALDVSSLDEAKRQVGMLAPYVGYFKVGLELLMAEGAPNVIKTITELGGKPFGDVKLKDIPNTVAAAARNLVRHGVWMFNVHILGGRAMMMAARLAVDELFPTGEKPMIFGVTVLTSMDANDFIDFGLFDFSKLGPEVVEAAKKGRLSELVTRLAVIANECGMDGVISSAENASAIREACGPELKIYTPGIRPIWAVAQDQKRPTTPADAILAGTDLLVIGRPIQKPPAEIGTPVDAAKRIADEIDEALAMLAKQTTT